MSAMKDSFDMQAERGRATIEAWRSELPVAVNDDLLQAAANCIADILHAVAQAGHDFRYVGREGIAYAEVSGADIYEPELPRVGA